jgi:hypothetical protein
METTCKAGREKEAESVKLQKTFLSKHNHLKSKIPFNQLQEMVLLESILQKNGFRFISYGKTSKNEFVLGGTYAKMGEVAGKATVSVVGVSGSGTSNIELDIDIFSNKKEPAEVLCQQIKDEIARQGLVEKTDERPYRLADPSDYV